MINSIMNHDHYIKNPNDLFINEKYEKLKELIFKNNTDQTAKSIIAQAALLQLPLAIHVRAPEQRTRAEDRELRVFDAANACDRLLQIGRHLRRVGTRRARGA